MSKLHLPSSRLICLGSARALTNAPKGEDEIEDDPFVLYS